jgi:hypothetical protein
MILKIKDAEGNVQEITAIKGEDYVLTEADKQEIAGMISGGGGGGGGATKMSELEQDLSSLKIGNMTIADGSFFNGNGNTMNYNGFYTNLIGTLVTIKGTNSTTIKNVVTPTEDKDAANKKYVDDKMSYLSTLTIGGALILSSNSVASMGTLNINARDGVSIINLKSPTNDTDAANKAYVDTAISNKGYLTEAQVLELIQASLPTSAEGVDY